MKLPNEIELEIGRLDCFASPRYLLGFGGSDERAIWDFWVAEGGFIGTYL